METGLARDIRQNFSRRGGPKTSTGGNILKTGVVLMYKGITSFQDAARKAMLDSANRKLIKNHLMPIFPIERGLIRTM
jgi:hypothetical protein